MWNALRLQLTGSVVQPLSCYDLLTYKAIGSNYLSFVVTSMLVSTSPLDEAGTATLWNELPSDIKSINESSLKSFCKKIKVLLK